MGMGSVTCYSFVMCYTKSMLKFSFQNGLSLLEQTTIFCLDINFVLLNVKQMLLDRRKFKENTSNPFSFPILLHYMYSMVHEKLTYLFRNISENLYFNYITKVTTKI